MSEVHHLVKYDPPDPEARGFIVRKETHKLLWARLGTDSLYCGLPPRPPPPLGCPKSVSPSHTQDFFCNVQTLNRRRVSHDTTQRAVDSHPLWFESYRQLGKKERAIRG